MVQIKGNNLCCIEFKKPVELFKFITLADVRVFVSYSVVVFIKLSDCCGST